MKKAALSSSFRSPATWAKAKGVRERGEAYEKDALVDVVVLEAEDVALEGDEAEFKVLDVDRAEHAGVCEDGRAERRHARHDEEVVHVRVGFRGRLDLI